MAGLLCSSYKVRMGHSDGMSMQFDFGSLLKKVEGLDEVTIPLKKEMDEVTKYMPDDRALGSDGFNDLFVKKYWSIVKHDFYRLASEFHE
jgi:hypothetical protein